ncbi:MAG: DnaJ domain-containing protein [Bacteroidota bacterium]
MKNYYLELLQLESGATKADIKKAYRRLSKKYHPDINNSEDAKEKFIAINEAYNFLNQVGPTPHRETISYDYDPLAEEYRRKREQAREKARQKAEVEARLKQKMYQRLIAFFNVSSAFILIINLIIMIDYFLPPKQIFVSPQELNEASARARNAGSGRGYHALKFDDFQIKLPEEAYYVKTRKLSSNIYYTPIFHTPLYLIPKTEGTRIYKQQLSLYATFGPAILMIILSGALYFFVLRDPDPKVYLAMFMITLALIQLYINSKYS